MDEYELARELRRMYESARRNEAACQVHLFGIRYSEELKACGCPLRKILELSGVSRGYLPEISKGMKLARYVTIRKEKEHE